MVFRVFLLGALLLAAVLAPLGSAYLPVIPWGPYEGTGPAQELKNNRLCEGFLLTAKLTDGPLYWTIEFGADGPCVSGSRSFAELEGTPFTGFVGHWTNACYTFTVSLGALSYATPFVYTMDNTPGSSCKAPEIHERLVASLDFQPGPGPV